MTSIFNEVLAAIGHMDVRSSLSDQKRHRLAADLSDFTISAIKKYINGQEEHGGDLEDRDVLTDMGSEIIDHVHYYNALKRKLKRGLL